MTNHLPHDDEEILLAFAVEPTHDRSTLERYLRSYPHLADDLIDLSLDLRLQRASDDASAPVDETWVETSWTAFQAANPAYAGNAIADPFAAATTDDLVALRRTLGVPSGVIHAFSTRLVDIASVPAWVVETIAQGIRVTADDIRAFTAGSNRLAAGLSYKSDEAPSVTDGKITFEELLVQCKVPEEKRQRLLEERA